MDALDQYAPRHIRTYRNLRHRERWAGWQRERRNKFETQDSATLTPEQRAEVDRRIEAHAERVHREMVALGIPCNGSKQ